MVNIQKLILSTNVPSLRKSTTKMRHLKKGTMCPTEEELDDLNGSDDERPDNYNKAKRLDIFTVNYTKNQKSETEHKPTSTSSEDAHSLDESPRNEDSNSTSESQKEDEPSKSKKKRGKRKEDKDKENKDTKKEEKEQKKLEKKKAKEEEKKAKEEEKKAKEEEKKAKEEQKKSSKECKERDDASRWKQFKQKFKKKVSKKKDKNGVQEISIMPEQEELAECWGEERLTPSNKTGSEESLDLTNKDITIVSPRNGSAQSKASGSVEVDDIETIYDMEYNGGGCG